MSRNAIWLIAGLLLVAFFGFQASQISSLKRELVAVKSELSAPAAEKNANAKSADTNQAKVAAAAQAARPVSSDGAGLQARLANLERSVAEFDRIHKILSDRGMMPPT